MTRLSRRRLVQSAGVVGLALLPGCSMPFSAPASPPRLRNVAYLSGGETSPTNYLDVLRQSLLDLGYAEGRNIVLEERYANGDEQAATFAAEIARLQPEVIVVPSATVARVVQSVTSTVAIVSVGQEDLREKGVVDNFARPSGNVTGLSSPSIIGKTLQLLHETVPALSRVVALIDATFGTSSDPYESAATALGLPLQVIWVSGLDDLNQAFSSMARDRTDGVIVSGGPFIQQVGEAPTVDLTRQYRLPSMWTRSEPVRLGGLLGYGANRADLRRRAATYVDKLLKGARPADLPIEQPSLFDFSLNVKTAQTLGLAIPPSVLAQATEVIQ